MLGTVRKGPLPNIRTERVTDAERLHDIQQKLRCRGYLSHYPEAERDVAWLLNRRPSGTRRFAELEVRLRRNELAFLLPARDGARVEVRSCDHFEFRDGKVARKDS